MHTTSGALLGGRVAYDQPATGYRTGVEPVLLAASVPALPGDRVLEAGLGAGAGLLCLLARVPGVEAVGVELDPAMAGLASHNLRTTGASVVTGDILSSKGVADFDHAYANPPWHDPSGTPSPNPRRRAAKEAVPGLLASWLTRLAGSVRPGGSVTVLVPAHKAGVALAGLKDASCGACVVYPLWPKARTDAKLVLVRGILRRRSPDRLSPGMIMHRADGSYTDEAQAVLSDAAPLPL